jgi:cyclic pyranopterin phosphate synthase
MEKSKEFTHIDDNGKVRMVDVSEDVFAAAKIAGINAAKKNWELIPLCHQIKITNVDIKFKILEKEKKVEAASVVKGYDRTGVEMEALTAVSISLLTIYDMCKAISKDMLIGGIELVSKTGGKSDYLK